MTIRLLALAFLFSFSTSLWAIEIRLKPEVLRQGDVLLVVVSGENPQGSFNNKKLVFFKTESDNHIALAGIDMKMTPGEYPLILISKDNKIFERIVKILPAFFGTQKLSLPKKMVDLSPEMLKRVNDEQARLAHLWPVFNEKIWQGKFIMPIDGKIRSPFGVRRIINGQEKNPHSGIDIETNEGDPVYAPNNGRVVLIDSQYLGGTTLVLDHGYGIYSTFYHLLNITVSEGQLVKKGALIAHAGKTGRTTGPHLHWGVRFQGERINPVSLINLELD